MKNFYKENSATKEQFLNVLEPILTGTLEYANSVIELFQKYKKKFLSEDDFIREMQRMKSHIDDLYKKSGNIPFPPDDCKDFDNTFQGLIGTVHNMSLFYENDGLKRWPQHNRDWLMEDQINRYSKTCI